MNKFFVSFETLQERAADIAADIEAIVVAEKANQRVRLYGVPRGGIPAVFLVQAALLRNTDLLPVLVDHPAEADVIIDDIIDSGATRDKHLKESPALFTALINKLDQDKNIGWVVFPWEGNVENGVEDNVRRLLQAFDPNPEREGLEDTPKRVAKAWEHWTAGYDEDPKEILKVFADGAEGCDEMVIVKDIPFYSKCEHHLADIFGTATVAYIPSGQVVGLSKLSRVVNTYARRLQVQERMTNQIADALCNNLAPVGVGVVIRARHMCMESRGICQQGHHTITSALRGVLKTDPSARAEFMSLANNNASL